MHRIRKCKNIIGFCEVWALFRAVQFLVVDLLSLCLRRTYVSRLVQYSFVDILAASAQIQNFPNS